MESMDLKVGELLKELRLDQSSKKIIDKAVAAVIKVIQATPEQKVGANAAAGFVRDLGVPSHKVEFTFKPPESVLVGGSYSIDSIVKPDVNVDLLIRMPKECFHEKDYLNHRYHAKRGLYLWVIQQHLNSSRAKNGWSTLQEEARKPVLIVFPEVKLDELSGLYIRIIPTATSLFNISRLTLNRNNVRAPDEGRTSQVSAKYNSSILEDMFLEENVEFVRNTFNDWRSLEEALVLLKVWAQNRTIYSHDCLNGFLTSAIVSYLAAGSREDHINKSMNAMQIFCVTLKFIASSSLWDKGFALQPPGQCNLSKEEMSQYLQYFGAVLWDASGHLNLAFRMTRRAFLEHTIYISPIKGIQLRDEAAWTLDCINNYADGGFEEIFMTKVDFPVKYDFCMRINLKGHSKVSKWGFCMDDECWRICEEKIHSLLLQGLNDRAKFVRVTWRSTPSDWNIEDGFSKFGSDLMLIGIAISSFSKSIRVIDIGPNAENKEEALKFREFWGEKSELRRFKDGTIAECTVWECEQWERHLIIKRIAEYVLSKHFLLSKDHMIHVADQLDFCLLHGSKDPIMFCGDLLQAFDLLSKRLRLLEDVPLKISSVQPLDPAYRYTSVFPPEPHPLAYEKSVEQAPVKFVPTCIQPLDVVIQLEGSGKWPSDSVAIEKTKSAFLLKIGESLQDRWGMFCTATKDDVDVLMSGYAFRLQILHERSLSLLANPVANGKIQGISSSDKELFVRSQHSSMINGLHGQYQTYGPIVRLAKRWVASHLFSSVLAEEAIELLVASLFLKPFPFCTPGSRVTGFLRFLRLLANYDWNFSPLVVDINNDLTSKDSKDISENFILSRKSFEGKGQNIETAMYLATNYDRHSEAWTKFSPTTSVLNRLVLYARSSGDLLTKLILQGQSGPYTWECLFRTPLYNYDAVVLLHRDKLAYPHRLLFPSEMNQGKHVIRGKPSKDFQPYITLGSVSKRLEDRNKLMVDFDPTRCYIEDLKKELSDTFNVWYDSNGGDAIGLTWEKHGSKKREREDESRRDPSVVLKEVGELGKGFVKSVYFLKAPRFQV